MNRRPALLALSCLLGLAATGVQAQDCPSRPITILVPYAPGGTTDILGRAFAASMGKTLGQTVIVENKPGAGGTMGVLDMRTAKPDGYRLTLVPVSVFRQPHVQKVQYDPIGGLTYIASFSAYDFIMGVAADSPYKTLQDVVADAKKHPNEVNYGTPGRNTGNHVAGALLARAAGVEMTHVPFKGDSEAINALLAGHIKTAILTNGSLTFSWSLARGARWPWRPTRAPPPSRRFPPSRKRATTSSSRRRWASPAPRACRSRSWRSSTPP